jgi:hypothetical protein
VLGCLVTLLQVIAASEKKRVALKRKITQMQTGVNESVQEAEKKIAKVKSQASKLPGLSNVLKAFL